MKRQNPCPLSKTGTCEYGGNRVYNYGFVSGTASYCRLDKRWVSDLKRCPKEPLDKRDYAPITVTT